MPTPTWAVLIILTSFAPSPILSVVHLFLRISHTISCFCFGVTRQHIIDLQELTSYSNFYYSVTFSKSYPVTTKQHYLPSGYCFRYASTSSTLSFHVTVAMSSERRPHEIPILMAVYLLSPVNIQTFTPANRSLWIVTLTLSWSWSSIAVAPISSSYFSITSSSYLVSLVEDVGSPIMFR